MTFSKFVRRAVLYRAVLYGTYWFAGMWIIRDLRQGIGQDRIVPLLVGSGVFAIGVSLLLWGVDHFTRKLGERSDRAYADFGAKIRQITREEKNPS